MKFVIHLHKMTEDHYDFMLDNGSALLTWRISPDDMERLVRGETISAEKIRDHRRAYLAYEGSISCDRGSVRRYDSGEYEMLSEKGDEMTITIRGENIRGTITIKDLGKEGCVMEKKIHR